MMKAFVVSSVVLTAVPRAALADGWRAEDCGGCNSDPSNGADYECSCSSGDPVAVGTGLGIVGTVAWRIGKKRRNR